MNKQLSVLLISILVQIIFAQGSFNDRIFLQKLISEWGGSVKEVTFDKYSSRISWEKKLTTSYGVARFCYDHDLKIDQVEFAVFPETIESKFVFNEKEFSDQELNMIKPYLLQSRLQEVKDELQRLSQKNNMSPKIKAAKEKSLQDDLIREKDKRQLFVPVINNQEQLERVMKEKLSYLFGSLDYQLIDTVGNIKLINKETVLVTGWDISMPRVNTRWDTACGRSPIHLNLDIQSGNICGLSFYIPNIRKNNRVNLKPGIKKDEIPALVEKYFIQNGGAFEKYVLNIFPESFKSKHDFELFLKRFGKKGRREFYRTVFSFDLSDIYIQDYIKEDDFPPFFPDIPEVGYYDNEYTSRVSIQKSGSSRLVYECFPVYKGGNKSIFSMPLCIQIDALTGEYLGVSDSLYSYNLDRKYNYRDVFKNSMVQIPHLMKWHAPSLSVSTQQDSKAEGIQKDPVEKPVSSTDNQKKLLGLPEENCRILPYHNSRM